MQKCDRSNIRKHVLNQLECVCGCSLSCVQLFATPCTAACQAPLSMEFSRKEYWSGLPILPPGDLPDPGMELMSPASFALAERLFTTKPWDWREVNWGREVNFPLNGKLLDTYFLELFDDYINEFCSQMILIIITNIAENNMMTFRQKSLN